MHLIRNKTHIRTVHFRTGYHIGARRIIKEEGMKEFVARCVSFSLQFLLILSLPKNNIWSIRGENLGTRVNSSVRRCGWGFSFRILVNLIYELGQGANRGQFGKVPGAVRSILECFIFLKSGYFFLSLWIKLPVLLLSLYLIFWSCRSAQQIQLKAKLGIGNAQYHIFISFSSKSITRLTVDILCYQQILKPPPGGKRGRGATTEVFTRVPLLVRLLLGWLHYDLIFSCGSKTAAKSNCAVRFKS